MGQSRTGSVSPTPHYHELQGRAAEIARSLGSPVAGAEHLFLGMIHDGGWPVSAIDGLVDLSAAEAAVMEIVTGPDYAPPALPPRAMLAGPRVQPWGLRTAADTGDSYVGVEHALIAMLRQRDSVPARALAGLADLGALEDAVLAAKDAPPRPPESALILPQGMEFPGPLSRVLLDHLPEDTTYGFNAYEGHTWVSVFGPDGPWDAAATREAVNAALASLGHPEVS
jgi:hypothetical protein